MTTITATASGGTRNWSDTATWSPAQVPTAADDVVLASTSGNVTIDVNAVCRSLDCQASGNYAGTLTLATVSLSIGTTTAAPSSRALRLSNAMTLTPGASTIQTVSSYAGVQTVEFGGKTLNNFACWNAAGCSTQLASALSASLVALGAGTLDTNSQAVTCGSFNSSNSNTRTLTLGSSTITCTGTDTTAWNCATPTNMTLNAGTSTIILSGSGAVMSPGANLAYSTIRFSGPNQQTLNLQSITVANLERIGTAGKSDSFRIQSGIGTITVTGTFTVTGNSATNRVLVQSDVLGTARTITAAAVSLTNVDFADITGAGAATWTGTSIGDCGGNTGITFTASVTRYGVVAGNWSSTATWSATSGGAGGASVPLPQDDVILDASSAAGTYTIDMPRACRNLTCTGFTRTLAISTASSNFGSLALAAGMTLSHSAAFSLLGRGSHTITSAGKAWSTPQVTIGAPGGTYTLADAFNCGDILSFQDGTFTTGGYSVTAGRLTRSGSARAFTFNAGASIITVTGGAGSNAVNFGTSNTTFNAGTSTIVLTDTSASTKNFIAGSLAFYRLLIQGGASNNVAITGANTWDRIDVPAGCVLTFPASVSQTFTGAGVVTTGANRGYIYLPGVVGNGMTVPDAANLQLADDIELLARVSVTTNITSTVKGIVGKYGTATYTNQRGYMLAYGVTGTELSAFFGFYGSTNGSATAFTAASTTPPLGDYWVRATRKKSTGDVKFFTAPDSLNPPAWDDPAWVQLGPTVPTGVTASLFASTAPVGIGSYDGVSSTGSSPMVVKRAMVRSGVDASATTVLDVDPANKPFGADSWVCATGQTVSVNGDLAKAGDGRVLLNSATPGTAATISKSGGQMVLPFTTVKDITFSGGAAFIAPPPSVLVSNTSGIRNGARYGISADGTQFFKY